MFLGTNLLEKNRLTVIVTYGTGKASIGSVKEKILKNLLFPDPLTEKYNSTVLQGILESLLPILLIL